MEKSDTDRKLHTKMRLWEFPDQYIVEPTDGTSDSYLSISRLDGSMNLIEDLPQLGGRASPKAQPLFGIVGMLRLAVGAYLLVITDAASAGTSWDQRVFRVASIKVLPCNSSLNKSTSEQKKMENEMFALLNAAEKTHGLFFSYNANLTLSAQRLLELNDESKQLPLWRQADPRFLWNGYMMEPFIDSNMDRYILPLIQGSFQNIQAVVGGNQVDVTLIARRCTRRIGTRLWRRGADSEGYTANFVESEQILQANGYLASLVQVRGSMPFLWEQIVDLTYKPGFEIVKPEEASRVAERHFLDLRKRYGSVLAVDLVNKHGGEGRLCEKYAAAVQSIVGEDLRYVHFDFHRVCGHVHFERLSILYDQIKDSLDKNGYLLLNPKGEKVEQQQGVVRTNCVDCLDRTNVTQERSLLFSSYTRFQETRKGVCCSVAIQGSRRKGLYHKNMIGRRILEKQLHRIGILSANESISSFPKFDSSYKILWANHGDDISIQYSGTPALKGDFVRFGQRTISGILNDGYNALARYYFNNFSDGKKQDSIDLLQGHYIVSISRDICSPFQTQGLETVASFKLAFSLFMVGIYFAMMSLRQGPTSIRTILFAFLWAGLSMGIAAFVRANGRMFTDRPRLNKPRR